MVTQAKMFVAPEMIDDRFIILFVIGLCLIGVGVILGHVSDRIEVAIFKWRHDLIKANLDAIRSENKHAAGVVGHKTRARRQDAIRVDHTECNR